MQKKAVFQSFDCKQKTQNRYFPTRTIAAPCSSGVAKREIRLMLRLFSRLLTATTIAMVSDKAGRSEKLFW